MQTYSQTFTGPQTWVLNIVGKYYVTLGCTNPVNVRFYQSGKKLDLGDVNGLLAGLEVERVEFDRVEIDATAADTITVGIGNGNARYNRAATTATVTATVPPRSGAFASVAKTVTNASAQLVAANASRMYLLIQNNDAAGSIFINFGAAATVAMLKIPPGGSYEMTAQSTQAINAIGDVANNPNIVVVEG